MPRITLPDASHRDFDHPVTVGAVAAAIGAGLAKAALAGRVDGALVDTSFLIERDVTLAIVTGRDTDVVPRANVHLAERPEPLDALGVRADGPPARPGRARSVSGRHRRGA